MMNHSEINGRRVAYLDKGEGPALLFGHSYLWNQRMWREQVAELSYSYRCIVPDLWAHGESDFPPATPYSLDALAEDHFTLMNNLGIDRFVIIGLSIGGMWAPRLALKHPNAVSGLVLMDTDAGAEPEISHAQFTQMFETIEQLGMIPDPVIDMIVPGFFSPCTHKERPELVAEFRDNLTNTPNEVVSGLITMGRTFANRDSILDKLPQLTAPTLVMVGSDDAYRPVKEAQRLAEHIPNADLAVIPDAGHISALEQPQAVNGRLVSFLNACTTSLNTA